MRLRLFGHLRFFRLFRFRWHLWLFWCLRRFALIRSFDFGLRLGRRLLFLPLRRSQVRQRHLVGVVQETLPYSSAEVAQLRELRPVVLHSRSKLFVPLNEGPVSAAISGVLGRAWWWRLGLGLGLRLGLRRRWLDGRRWKTPPRVVLRRRCSGLGRGGRHRCLRRLGLSLRQGAAPVGRRLFLGLQPMRVRPSTIDAHPGAPWIFRCVASVAARRNQRQLRSSPTGAGPGVRPAHPQLAPWRIRLPTL
jgi:hypothetical protein